MTLWGDQIRFVSILKFASLLVFTMHLAANVACAQTPTVEILMVDGAKAVGTMVEVTLDQLKLENDAGSTTVVVEQIEAITLPLNYPKQPPSFSCWMVRLCSSISTITPIEKLRPQ